MRSRISGVGFHFQGRVDAGHDALAGGFFVAGGAVDLSGEEEAGDFLGLERAMKFGRIDRIVFDGVAGTHHFGVFEAGNGLQDCQLHVDGQRGAHAVDVNLVRGQALGFEEELMAQLVGKFDDLVFDRRAVTRADGLNLPAVHR